MDSDDYRIRDKAQKDLSALGPAAFGAMRKALAGDISDEAKARLQKILEQDAGQYLAPK